MTETWNTIDVEILTESCDLECKAAQGRDGRGELPDDFWKSYSAMANTEGGEILLGIQEKPQGHFKMLGLSDVERVRKAIWDNLHNRKQVSENLLAESDVQPVMVDGKTILRVHVPRAPRQRRPVHLGSNPFGGTYLRRHEGDYTADDEAVRRLMAERVEDSRDERVLKGFGVDDLDMETVAVYRNRFAAVRSGHVWSDLPVEEFLEKVGAVGRNREEGFIGLRIAGLLMFGRAETIREVLPHYMVDYQERPEAKTERRWVDRLVPDGTWSGNLYDFFRRVYQKLTADLKVPFQLQEGQRIDDSPVHEALREALANTLIHADYSGRVSVLVVKRPDMFGFRNPGRMRIPPEIAVHGGNSDCRNRRLQTMFQLVGYGDHAGSGLPKIYSNWAGQHWRRPVLFELPEPEQTLMELRMSSLVPAQAVAELEARFGDRFRALPELSRLALITADAEGMVSHARLREISTEHPADITKLLANLVRDNMLVSAGTGRGMVYFLPWQKQAPGRLFDEPGELAERAAEPPEVAGLSSQSAGLSSNPEGLSSNPLWSGLPPEVQSMVAALGQRAAPHKLKEALVELCRHRAWQASEIASLFGKNPDYLKTQYLRPLVQARVLAYTRPEQPNHPEQAYTIAKDATTQS